MTIKMICEDPSKHVEYVNYILSKCVGVEGLPMQIILSLDEGQEDSLENKNVALEEYEREDNKIIENRDLRIDTFIRRVWLDDDELNLTKKEFDILVFFAKNPYRVLTKEEIYNNVWTTGEESEINKDSLTVHVNNLRKKIKCPHEEPKFIQSIWGVGYRFLI